MAKRRRDNPLPPGWPTPPGDDRTVVLHTRVVTNAGGGPDKTILLSAPFLAHTRYWLAAAYMHPPGDPGFETIRRRAKAYNSPLIDLDDRGPLDHRLLPGYLDACRRYNVRVWHAHDYKSNLIGVMLRPFHEMKLVTTLHGYVERTARTPLYYAVDRWSLPLYHHVIAVSDDLYERARKLGVAADRCTLIENGIDEKTFARKHPPAESPLRRDRGVPPGRLVIGAVGRLSAEKAFNLLIHAAHNLIGEGIDLELWIAGEGGGKEDLQKLIDHLGVKDRVKLLGFCSDTIGLYHAMDLFVLSSIREGLPNVVLEAMAMGVPVVSTKVAGVPKLLTHEKDGLLCEVGDTGALTAQIRRMALDPELRANLAAAARRHIENSYSFTQRMAKEKAIYDRLFAPTSSEVASARG